jgi:hypothetical protein
MIGLGIRLTVASGREAIVRLLVTAVAMAFGVGLLLSSLAGLNALNAENARAAWLNTSSQNIRPSVNPKTTDPMWWLYSAGEFDNLMIERVDVAASGPRAPITPGIPGLPGPGQFYASPALVELLHSTPTDELGARFPAHLLGTIGASALPTPNSLIAVVGENADALSKLPGAEEVRSIETATGGNSVSGGPGNFSSLEMEMILAIGALALLLPVLIFIATATRLSVGTRERRFAAMRLVGATPLQVSKVAGIEASIAALLGMALGFGLFFAIRPGLYEVSFTGAPFAPGDLSLSLVGILVVALGVPFASVLAARIALRRVNVSPLGVTRKVTPPAPAPWRTVPLLAGIAWLAFLAVAGHPKSASSQIQTYFLSFLLIMGGLVLAGPWLTMIGGRRLAQRADRPEALLAGRRLSDNPRGSFRAIGGLILALFIASVAVGISGTIVAVGSAGAKTSSNDTLVQSFATNAKVASGVITSLASTNGVQAVTLIHSDPLVAANGNLNLTPGLVSCAELARTPALGSCAPGAVVATIRPDLGRELDGRYTPIVSVWPAADITTVRLQALPLRALIVRTSGTAGVIAQAQTALEAAFPDESAPSIVGGITPDTARSLIELQDMTNVIIIASLLIAGCSLAVSVAAGMSERKRPFSLLRLAGVPIRMLRRVVALEAAAPLLVIAVLASAIGLLAAELFLRGELSVSLRLPGLGYYLIVGCGIIASLGIIASTLPLIDRMTGPEVARNE